MPIAPIVFFAAATFDDSFRAGLLALQRNDLVAARTGLETASNLAPGNPRVWIALAQTYRKLGITDKAAAAAVKAEALEGKDAVVLSSLALYYGEAGDLLKAADAQARYAELVPDNTSAREKAESLYFEPAQRFLQESKYSEALPFLLAGSTRMKDSAQLQLGLGVAYYGLRRFDDAATAFLRTMEIQPELKQPYVFLGRFLDQVAARMPDVTTKFVEFEKSHPEDPTGFYLHAKALNVEGADAEDAMALLRKALTLSPNDASIHFELGVVYDRTRRYPEAAQEFEKAASLAPNDAATHYRLSRVYDRLGRTDAARAERERHAQLEKSAREGK